jgi:hypothetical protein
MNALSRWTVMLMGMTVVACQDAAAPSARSSASSAVHPAFDQAAVTNDGASGASGRGVYSLAGSDVQFALNAVRLPDGGAIGTFHQRLDEGGGLIIEFDAQVVCLAVDAANQRAWIGGVVTQNESTDPDYLTAINQPGRDVWFRVLNGADVAGGTDRSTFLGFQGAAGIETSPEYCAARLWPDNNARTWPVISGAIRVHP